MMRTYRKLLLAAAGILGLATAGGAHAAPWIKAQSTHFIVYSDAGEPITERYLTNLEKYRYVLGTLFHVRPEVDDAAPPTEIYLIDTSKSGWKDIYPDAPPGAAGVTLNNTEGQVVMATAPGGMPRQGVGLDQVPADTGQIIVFHEYAHNFMFHNSEVKYPPWFIEGFAEFYSTTRLSDDEALVGMAWEYRASFLHGPTSGLRYADILRARGAIWSKPEVSLLYYAQSWLLTHYILSDEDRRHKFSDYVAAYDKGEDPVAAFERIFGIPVDHLSEVLETYLTKNLKAAGYKMSGMPAPKIKMTSLPASSRKLLAWKASVATYGSMRPETRTTVLDEIRKEAARYPDDAFALKALARAEDVLGDPAKAVAALKSYVDAHPDDSEAQALLGEGYYLMAKRGPIPDGETAAGLMDRARGTLVKTYKLDPKNATALYYLSLAQEDRPDFPNDMAVDAAMQAHNLAPQVASYSIRAAVLLVMTDRLDEGEAMLTVVATNPHSPGLAKWATDVIAAIDRGAPKADILALLTGPTAPKP